MHYYRICVLGEASRFITAEEVKVETDEEAMNVASSIYQRYRREIWQRDRYVGNIEADISGSAGASRSTIG